VNSAAWRFSAHGNAIERAEFGEDLVNLRAQCYTERVAKVLALVGPEEWLKRAMQASTSAERMKAARQGLATRGPLDKTTQAMLLRQLYLALFEDMAFKEAYEVAVQAADLGVLADVLLQDAARAALACRDLDSALKHLRGAARSGPASRKPFHQWTLGSVLFLAQRYEEAIRALSQAARWGTRDKPLYRAHLALAKIAAGQRVDNLDAVFKDLAEAPCGQGYGRFVLGHLAYAARERVAAKRYLETFVKRTKSAPSLQAIALSGELQMSEATLAKMAAN
jgi:tetratricopeptide (TPR) repeat protein